MEQQSIHIHNSLPSSDIILNSIIDGVIIIDDSSMILYVNPAAEKLFNKGGRELIGATFGYPMSAAEVQEIQVLHDGRVKTIQMLATSITWNSHQACLISLRDVSDLVAISHELEEKKSKLEQSNLELEQYASLASHDLKEPIRKVKLFSQHLIDKNPQFNTHIKAQLLKINQAADRMRTLIAGIAEFSRVVQHPVGYEKTDLNKVMDDVLQDLELMIQESDAQLHIDDLPVIDAVTIQMHQLMLNLVSNALKYKSQNAKPVILIRAEEDDEYAVITVVDNGVGFDNRLAEKIFRPFQRLLQNDVEGTGIGLAICKKIVELHGGEIVARSDGGDGAQFRFTLKKKQGG